MWDTLLCYVRIPYYFEFKMPSNLRHTSLLKRNFQEKIFESKCISHTVKFTTLLVTPLVFRGK